MLSHQLCNSRENQVLFFIHIVIQHNIHITYSRGVQDSRKTYTDNNDNSSMTWYPRSQSNQAAEQKALRNMKSYWAWVRCGTSYFHTHSADHFKVTQPQLTTVEKKIVMLPCSQTEEHTLEKGCFFSVKYLAILYIATFVVSHEIWSYLESHWVSDQRL